LPICLFNEFVLAVSSFAISLPRLWILAGELLWSQFILTVRTPLWKASRFFWIAESGSFKLDVGGVLSFRIALSTLFAALRLGAWTPPS
jgi:hypothetical protein